MKKVDELILELAEQGRSDSEIAEQLNREGHRNRSGGHYTDKSVQARRRRAGGSKGNGRPKSDITDISEPTTMPHPESERSDASDKTDPSEPSEVSDSMKPLPDAWRDQIVLIVQTEVQRIVESQIFPEDQTSEMDLAPVPDPKAKVVGEKGRKVNQGTRVKIAGTCDEELARRLEQWRIEQGISLSRALDTALWHFLGKPRLSFEEPESTDPADES